MILFDRINLEVLPLKCIVLILVLVDDTLWLEWEAFFSFVKEKVLILVLVDDTLWSKQTPMVRSIW